MLRVVLAVVLSVALLGVTMPVVEDARAERTGSLAAGELTRLTERAIGLAATEETGPGGDPRRIVDLSLPGGGFATAPLEYVAIGGVPDERGESVPDGTATSDGRPPCGGPLDTAHGDVVAYRIEGGDTHVGHVPVDLRVVADGRVGDDARPLVLRGDARVTLTLVDRGGQPTVLVRRGTATDRAIEATGSRDARA